MPPAMLSTLHLIKMEVQHINKQVQASTHVNPRAGLEKERVTRLCLCTECTNVRHKQQGWKLRFQNLCQGFLSTRSCYPKTLFLSHRISSIRTMCFCFKEIHAPRICSVAYNSFHWDFKIATNGLTI